MNENEYHISWTAHEYDHREHTADWYWAVGIVSVSLAIAFVLVGNMLLSVIILIGMTTLLAYAKHPPRTLDYKISKDGISAGKTLYPWSTLDSFWITDEHNTAKEYRAPKLLIISKKPFMPHIVIPLTEFVVDETHHVLCQMLHEEPQFEPLHDRLMRLIGF